MSNTAPTSPRLSVILATDTYATIQSVVKCMWRQTIRESIEIVLIGRSTEDLSQALKYRDEFAEIQILEHPVEDLAPARAVGVLAAKAPYIFIGETHSYPYRDALEKSLELIESSDCSVVAPSIGNGNPVGALSSSGVILDYGQWGVGLPAGPITLAPIFNSVFKKSIFLELGDRLAPALGQADDLAAKMRAENHRILFEPKARIDHVNVTRPWHWTLNRFYCGALIAGARSREWPLGKRILYIGGSFLIPAVLLRRIYPGVSASIRAGEPAGTLPAIAAGLILRACGEVFGYAGLLRDAAHRGMYQYEVHKLKYAARRSA